jgi:hypothetical protein
VIPRCSEDIYSNLEARFCLAPATNLAPVIRSAAPYVCYEGYRRAHRPTGVDTLEKPLYTHTFSHSSIVFIHRIRFSRWLFVTAPVGPVCTILLKDSTRSPFVYVRLLARPFGLAFAAMQGTVVDVNFGHWFIP